MITETVFLRDPTSYRRNVDPRKHYKEQMEFAIMRQFTVDRETAKAVLQSIIDEHQGVTDPTVVHYERDMDTEDKALVRTPLSRYLDDTIKQNHIMVPSGTRYVQPSVKTSLYAETIDKDAARRSEIKKYAAALLADKRMDEYQVQEDEQTNIKLDNNVYSGLFNANGNIIYNPSAHSSLTSTTRTITSIGNANNERMISGNRHYRDFDICINNLIYIANLVATDLTLQQRLNAVMLKYQLHFPTVTDVMTMVLRSTRLYWEHPRLEKQIETFLASLQPLELAGILYLGDLYHIRVHNDGFMRTFIGALIARVSGNVDECVIEELENGDGEVINLVNKLFMEEMRGKGKKYRKIAEEEKQLATDLHATYRHIESTLMQYYDFIEAFLITENIPPSIAAIPTMVRRSGVMGDTDSTCTSGGKWGEWWVGDVTFNQNSRAAANAALFISSQTMRHLLAVCSGNMGIGSKRIFKLSMKPEFYWDVFAATDVAKTYYAQTDVKEGSVFEKPKLEKKGVNLKNSNAAMRIREKAESLMIKYTSAASKNLKLNMYQELRDIADLERAIQTSLETGKTEFYRSISIKGEKGYKLSGERSNYRHYTFWREIYGPKYATMPTIPFKSLKVNTVLKNKTAIKNWIESIEDKAVAKRLTAYFERTGRDALKTIYVPIEHIGLYGMPVEITSIINYTDITLDLVNMCYIVLSTLNYHKKPGLRLIDAGY